MARYDSNLGMWIATGADGKRLGAFRTQQEAQAAEASNTAKVNPAITADEFRAATNAGAAAGGNILVARPVQTAAEIEALERMRLADADAQRLRDVPYGTPSSQGGTANQFQV